MLSTFLASFSLTRSELRLQTVYKRTPPQFTCLILRGNSDTVQLNEGEPRRVALTPRSEVKTERKHSAHDPEHDD